MPPTRKRRFAGYPDAIAYEKPDGKKAVDHLIWGSYVGDTGVREGSYTVEDVHGVERSGAYARVHVRERDEDCWIREHEIQDERLLEVIFVDIGQGDGCLVVTPKDKHLVIDAGEGDNMFRFLRWRYGKFKQRWNFEAAVISHPDADHYAGFDRFFDEDNVHFETVYHNGIMERYDSSGLGPKQKDGRRSYLTDLIRTKTELRAFLADTSNWQRISRGRLYSKQYPTMLKKGLDNESYTAFRMLSTADGHMPGYGPDEELEIQVLGPVPETAADGSPRLRWLSGKGMTKNGHSVVLRARYRDVRLLLAGDLNIPSENLLLSHHTGMDCPPGTVEDEQALVEAARAVFQVDIAKSCHHGSSDFSTVFLKAANPIATVISSGDDEPHSHPRADALGSIGVHSRGTRPLIFSTELARSAKEAIKHPHVLRANFKRLEEEIDKAPESTEAERKKKKKLREAFHKEIDRVLNRSIAVYGAINVVTDGRKVVVAQMIERGGAGKKWDIYRLEADGNGPLRYRSKH